MATSIRPLAKIAIPIFCQAMQRAQRSRAKASKACSNAIQRHASSIRRVAPKTIAQMAIKYAVKVSSNRAQTAHGCRKIAQLKIWFVISRPKMVAISQKQSKATTTSKISRFSKVGKKIIAIKQSYPTNKRHPSSIHSRREPIRSIMIRITPSRSVRSF